MSKVHTEIDVHISAFQIVEQCLAKLNFTLISAAYKNTDQLHYMLANLFEQPNIVVWYDASYGTLPLQLGSKSKYESWFAQKHSADSILLFTKNNIVRFSPKYMEIGSLDFCNWFNCRITDKHYKKTCAVCEIPVFQFATCGVCFNMYCLHCAADLQSCHKRLFMQSKRVDYINKNGDLFLKI